MESQQRAESKSCAPWDWFFSVEGRTSFSPLKSEKRNIEVAVEKYVVYSITSRHLFQLPRRFWLRSNYNGFPKQGASKASQVPIKRPLKLLICHGFRPLFLTCATVLFSGETVTIVAVKCAELSCTFHSSTSDNRCILFIPEIRCSRELFLTFSMAIWTLHSFISVANIFQLFFLAASNG